MKMIHIKDKMMVSKLWKLFSIINIFLDLDDDLEDILKELKELESNNKFHEGDIISKSSKTRVKRKSGSYINSHIFL